MNSWQVFSLLDDLGCGKRSGESLLQKEEQSIEALTLIAVEGAKHTTGIL